MRVYNSHGLSLCLPPTQVAFTHVFYFAAVYFIGKYVCMYVYCSIYVAVSPDCDHCHLVYCSVGY